MGIGEQYEFEKTGRIDPEPSAPEKLVWAPAYQMYVFESDRTPCPWDMILPCGPCDQILGNVLGIRTTSP